MTKTKLSYKTYASLTLFGILVYAVVSSRNFNEASASGTVQISDCSNPLDQADTIYQLTDNIVGNCTVTANNVTINGDDLNGGRFSIGGRVTNGSTENISFSLENVNIGAYVHNYSDTGSAGNLSIINSEISDNVRLGTSAIDYSSGNLLIENSSVSGTVHNIAYQATLGNVSIINSEITGYLENYSYKGSVGDLIITDSNINSLTSIRNKGLTGAGNFIVTNSDITGSVRNYSYSGTVGDFSITDSDIAGYVMNSSYSGTVGDLSITDSDIAGYVRNYSNSGNTGNLTITNSTTEYVRNSSSSGITGDISIIRSEVYGYKIGNFNYTGYGYITSPNPGFITIEDSVLIGNVYGDPDKLTIIDTPPTLEITPLDMEIGFDDVFDPLVNVIATDQVGRQVLSLIDDVQITGTVGEEPGEYILEYSVTDQGTTITFNEEIITSTPPTNTTTLTRTITRLAEDTPAPTRRSGSIRGGSSQAPQVQAAEQITEQTQEEVTKLKQQLLQLLTQLLTLLQAQLDEVNRG